MQPVILDPQGHARFLANQIVRDLLDFATPKGFDLNHIATRDYSSEDQMQFAQLIGYSVGGYGELDYVSQRSYTQADNRAEKLFQSREDSHNG